MNPIRPDVISAEVVLPAGDLATTLAFFTTGLGFRLCSIGPADAPTTAVIEGHGLRLRLAPEAVAPGTLRICCAGQVAPAALIAPNGSRIEFAAADAPVVLPPLQPSFALARFADAVWHEGRAGMRYRDLIPGRQGGRFIASHIEIAAGGPVPDYVHWHRIAIQIIYCRRGSVQVVYEDQGPPFSLAAGDCVLQPPGIRHRVLAAGPGLEVIEISCPAEHETLVDPELELPTAELRPDCDFGGQRFVRHTAATAAWSPWRRAGFAARELGIRGGSMGRASAQVVRRAAGALDAGRAMHEGELLFWFVLAGALTIGTDREGTHRLSPGDAVTLPRGLGCALVEASPDLELLEVIVPGQLAATLHP